MIPLHRLADLSARDLAWFQPALDLLDALPSTADRRLQTFLSPKLPLYIARAPGRLDVMGGIADYSGARVLELPLVCSTFALVQAQQERGGHCDIATRRAKQWDFFSIDLPLAEPVALAAWFREHKTERWASYVVGVVQALLARSAVTGGLRILIDSSVPEGRGVTSSAALEVAVAAAVAASRGIEIGAAELAALCQTVENHVVGAPCGIMDQMTSACGKRDRMLQLRCQPGTIEGYIEVPSGFRFYGIDSGISHAVSGADYGTVRTAAFMGYRMIAAEAGFAGGYTVVLADRRYPVRRAAQHPVDEQDRVDRFAKLLNELSHRPSVATEIGRLMYGSHQSYSACGLGSHGTDRLVELVRAAGPDCGLFGAKITGGGSGGTVAVFGTHDAEAAVRDIATGYAAETGCEMRVFAESGPGAAETGVLLP